MKNRFVELVFLGEFQIKEEELTYGKDEVLVRSSAKKNKNLLVYSK